MPDIGLGDSQPSCTFVISAIPHITLYNRVAAGLTAYSSPVHASCRNRQRITTPALSAGHTLSYR